MVVSNKKYFRKQKLMQII